MSYFAQSSLRLRYSFPLLTFAAVFLVRLALMPVVEDHSPLLLFTLPVITSAVLGGFGPGAVATVLGSIGGGYLLFHYSGGVIAAGHGAVSVYRLLLFLVLSLAMTWIGSQLRARTLQAVAALEKVRVLTGLLPMCAGCKMIRDERGDWEPLEVYIASHSEAQVSHGLCPSCVAAYLGEKYGERTEGAV